VARAFSVPPEQNTRPSSREMANHLENAEDIDFVTKTASKYDHDPVKVVVFLQNFPVTFRKSIKLDARVPVSVE
jgi:hypothetical protein